MVSNHFSFAYAVFSSIWVYKAYTINTLRSKPQTAQDPLFLVWIYIFLHWIFMFNLSELKKKQWLCSNPVSLWSLTLLVAGCIIEQKLHYQHLELVASGEDQVCDTDLAAAWDAWRQEWKTLLEKLCSLLAQHIQRYDSSLRTWSHTVITESLQSSSCAGWTRGDGMMELFAGLYQSPVSCKQGKIAAASSCTKKRLKSGPGKSEVTPLTWTELRVTASVHQEFPIWSMKLLPECFRSLSKTEQSCASHSTTP